MIKINTLIFTSVIILLSGCAGTLSSRIPDDKRFSSFGGYPYQAIYEDKYIIVDSWNDPYISHYGLLFSLIGLLSVPVDLTLDTIALPVDLVCWSREMERPSATGISGFKLQRIEDAKRNKFHKIQEKKSAQQVDSAEAATND